MAMSSMAPDAAAAVNPKQYPHQLRCLSPNTTMAKAIELIGPRFKQVPLEKSNFVKPASVTYDWNGTVRRWDIVESHASIGVVLYHRGMDALLIVRQFRPPVYASAAREAAAMGKAPPPFSVGFTHELCAGIMDKPGLSLQQICEEEVAEECGYKVEASAFHHIAPAVSASGTSGALHEMFYAEVDDSMRMDGGGGGEVSAGEFIELLALPLENAPAFIMDGSMPKSPGLMFGLFWAYHEIRAGRRGGRGSRMEAGPLELASVLTA